MNILLLGHIGKGNFGDDFMTMGLLKFLTDKYKSLELTCLSSEIIIKSNKVTYKNETLSNIIKYLFLSDIVIINGGNYLHDYSSNIRFKYSPFIKFGIISQLSYLFRKRLIFTGQGFGPFNSRLSKLAFRLIFRKVNFLSVRDHESLRLFKHIMPAKQHAKCKLTMDSTYYLSKYVESRKSNIVNSKPVIGINLLPFYEKYRNDKERDVALAEEVYELLKILFSTHKFSNSIIFCVFNRKKSESELNLFNLLESRFSKHKNICVEYLIYKDVDSFIEKYSQIDLFIGMRLHGIILSQILGINQMNIAYHPKCENIAKTLGLPKHKVIPIDSFNSNNVNIDLLIGDEVDRINLKSDLNKKFKLFKKYALPINLMSIK